MRSSHDDLKKIGNVVDDLLYFIKEKFLYVITFCNILILFTVSFVLIEIFLMAKGRYNLYANLCSL